MRDTRMCFWTLIDLMAHEAGYVLRYVRKDTNLWHVQIITIF